VAGFGGFGLPGEFYARGQEKFVALGSYSGHRMVGDQWCHGRDGVSGFFLDLASYCLFGIFILVAPSCGDFPAPGIRREPVTPYKENSVVFDDHCSHGLSWKPHYMMGKPRSTGDFDVVKVDIDPVAPIHAL
jgi:hypothetical protein